jgi:hypothetical protein
MSDRNAAAGLAGESPAPGMVLGLRLAALAALVAAIAGLVPGPVGDAGSVVMAVVLVAAPLVRVAWLAVAWWRAGDRRYAVTGFGLLLVVGAGAVLAIASA